MLVEVLSSAVMLEQLLLVHGPEFFLHQDNLVEVNLGHRFLEVLFLGRVS